MARMSPSAARSKVAKEILRARWECHPTIAAGAGLHRYDGRLPDYTKPSVRRRVARIDRQLRALDAIEARSKPTGLARVELGVLRGMLMKERVDLADLREHEVLPPYHLFRLSVLNYLLRGYAPLDRRLRAVARLQGQVPRYLRDFRATVRRRLPETYYEMAEMAARGIADQYARELPEHLGKASPAVRRLAERANGVAANEVKILANELEAKYKPRVKKEFAIGRRKYERMVRAEHIAPLSVERLLAVGMTDLEANKRAFVETAAKIDGSKTPPQVLEDISRDHPSPGSLVPDTQRMLEELRQFVIDHDIVTVPSEERARVTETPRFYRFATAAMNSPGSFEKVAKEAFYYVTPVE
ncbi:MAG: DUF885 family protein, partial [Candidatus Thermoplasmatota archaeon]